MFLIEKLLDDITTEEIHSKEEKYILEYGTLFNGFNKIHAINEKRKNPQEYLKQWRSENKELCSSYNKNYYEQNKDKFEKYREKRKEYQKQYRIINKEKNKQYQKEYYQNKKQKNKNISTR